MITLMKHNLCIRPIGGTSARKGNTAQKRRNREIKNLLRTWEKDAEVDLDNETKHLVADLEDSDRRERDVSL